MAYSTKKQNPIELKEKAKPLTNPGFANSDNVTLHVHALNALDEMKRLEAERKDELIAVRIDSKTIIYATPERAEYLIGQLSKDPLRRGGAYSRIMNI